MGRSGRQYNPSLKVRVALEIIRNRVDYQSIGQSIWDSSGPLQLGGGRRCWQEPNGCFRLGDQAVSREKSKNEPETRELDWLKKNSSSLVEKIRILIGNLIE